jgi:AcrR family transcriptional regulator
VTRQRLLAAAASEVAERGIAAASLDAISARAGLTKGAVYSTFGSRGELLLAMVDALPQPDIHIEVSDLATMDWDALGRDLAAVADVAPQQVLLLMELMSQAGRDSSIHVRLAARMGSAAERLAEQIGPMLGTSAEQAREVSVRLQGQVLGLWAMRVLLGPERVPASAFRDAARALAVAAGEHA